MIVLDTHILVWATNNDGQLGRETRALIDRHWRNGNVCVSALTFWEAGLLQERNRLRLGSPIHEWRDSLIAAGLTELPLNGAIALRALDLSSLPYDPADRFIVATALVHNAALVTADEKLLNWRHALERHDGTV